MQELEFATLDVTEQTPRLWGWLDAVQHGFLEPRANEAVRDAWRRSAVADQMSARGAWLPAGCFGAGAQPVATLAGYDQTVQTGRELLAARLITAITVDPAHRRQGLLRTLITEELAGAVARGLPMAALTVSEAGIYGRFGFGCSTRRARVELETARFGLRPEARAADGRTVVVDPREHGDTVTALFAQYHRSTAGSVGRSTLDTDLVTGRMDEQEQGENRRLRGAVSLDGHDQPDGYVVWQPTGHEEPRTARVTDLVATTPDAYLRLWDLLGNLDLCDRVTWDCAPAEDDPLRWALTEPHCLRTAALRDHVWVRVLDVPRVLESRGWSADGEVVLGVTDTLGYVTGSYRVRTTAGTAEVTPTSDEPDLRMDAEALGSFALGDPVARGLAAAGQIRGTDDVLERWTAMSGGRPVPHGVTFF